MIINKGWKKLIGYGLIKRIFIKENIWFDLIEFALKKIFIWIYFEERFGSDLSYPILFRIDMQRHWLKIYIPRRDLIGFGFTRFRFSYNEKISKRWFKVWFSFCKRFILNLLLEKLKLYFVLCKKFIWFIQVSEFCHYLHRNLVNNR